MPVFKISWEKRYSMLVACDNCDFLYIPNSNSQKYCEDCQDDVKREQSMLRMREYRKRYGFNNKKEELGTGLYLKGNMKEDPSEEMELIRKEMTSIGLPSKIREVGLRNSI